MRKLLAAVAAALAVGGMAACSSNPDEATVTVTKTAESSKPTTSTKPSATPTTEAEPAGQTAEQPAEGPGIDGWVPVSTEVSYQCPQTDAFVSDPSQCTPENLGAVPPQDLSTVAFADGGTCAAAICGYGHDENGNRNPTSGELQGQHGCEQGYITDPDYCAQVAEITGN
ncbi:hypothetical protein [Dietzia sp.]|uniref:hypothetical protein n=1 Tax=Dietzia sp. TaxID=1871616 RepID=UPI002FD87D95